MVQQQDQNFYHLMLGLPDDVTAPDHYVLLGLEHFESDAEVIHQAAVKRNIQLRAWDNSKFYEIADQITDEVVVARCVLLDSEDKARYDQRLRRELGIVDFPAATEDTADRAPVSASGRRRGDVSPAAVELRKTDESQTIRSLRQPTREGRPPTPAREASGKIKGKKRDVGMVVLATLWGVVCLAAVVNASYHLMSENATELTSQIASQIAEWWSSEKGSESEFLNAPFDRPAAQKAQQDWANRLKTEVVLTNSIGMKLVLIPPGQFLMGSPYSDKDAGSDEQPQHRVRITKAYYLGQTEVTQGQWQAVMGTQPWTGQRYVKEGADYPATYVSWDDAQEFCQRLSQKEGATYRLPTEAEWEQACRAGTTKKYCFGDDASRLGDYAWYNDNAYNAGERYAHQVGMKQSNPFGLFDMYGNVWEWCQDRYDRRYYATSPFDDPLGPGQGSVEVSRGGSWHRDARDCRSAVRSRFSPDFGLGFRLAHSQSLPDASETAQPVASQSAPPISSQPAMLTPPFDQQAAQKPQ